MTPEDGHKIKISQSDSATDAHTGGIRRATDTSRHHRTSCVKSNHFPLSAARWLWEQFEEGKLSLKATPLIGTLVVAVEAIDTVDTVDTVDAVGAVDEVGTVTAVKDEAVPAVNALVVVAS